MKERDSKEGEGGSMRGREKLIGQFNVNEKEEGERRDEGRPMRG